MERAVSVVDPWDPEDFYPIVSDLKSGQLLDPLDLRERIDEIVAKGFNTLSVGISDARPGSEPGLAGRMDRFAEAYAATKGMVINSNGCGF